MSPVAARDAGNPESPWHIPLWSTPYDIAPPAPDNVPPRRRVGVFEGVVPVPLDLLMRLELVAFGAAHPHTWQEVRDLLAKHKRASMLSTEAAA